jgi:hypothetical protein
MTILALKVFYTLQFTKMNHFIVSTKQYKFYKRYLSSILL